MESKPFDANDIREIEYDDTENAADVMDTLSERVEKIHTEKGFKLRTPTTPDEMTSEDRILTKITPESIVDFKKNLVQQVPKNKPDNVTDDNCNSRGCLFYKTGVRPAGGKSRHVNASVKYIDENGKEKSGSVKAHKLGWWLYTAGQDSSKLGHYATDDGKISTENIEHACTGINGNTQGDPIPNQMCVHHMVKGSNYSNQTTRGIDQKALAAQGRATKKNPLSEDQKLEFLEYMETQYNIKKRDPSYKLKSTESVVMSIYGAPKNVSGESTMLRRGSSHPTGQKFYLEGKRVDKSKRNTELWKDVDSGDEIHRDDGKDYNSKYKDFASKRAMTNAATKAKVLSIVKASGVLEEIPLSKPKSKKGVREEPQIRDPVTVPDIDSEEVRVIRESPAIHRMDRQEEQGRLTSGGASSVIRMSPAIQMVHQTGRLTSGQRFVGQLGKRHPIGRPPTRPLKFIR